MPRGNRQMSWLVCERTGCWAAALRVAVARQSSTNRSRTIVGRINEFRGLAEFSESLPNGHPAIALVEVAAENLADVLEFFSTHRDQNLRFVALMDESWGKPAGKPKPIIREQDFICDALFEAGAADILETPRQISRLLPMVASLARAGSCFGKAAGDDSIAEMAKLTLPWQDD